MTERLYYHDSHLAQFDARVLNVADEGAGRFSVTLDRTAFYPTGGGQPSDTGTLGAARVLECVDEEEAGIVRHIIAGAPPEVGAQVAGQIDWARRLDHLQQHTGQHILSQAFVQLFDAPTRAFRMLERASEIDLELREPSSERIEQAVELANRVIWEDRPVHIRHASAEEAAALPLRKDSARAGELRIIEIENFDLSPCGGTHAARTGEVGIIAMRSWERAKGLTRVEFLAGGRVLADYRRANHTARSVAALFSAGRDDASELAARALEENKTLTRRLRTLEEVAARVEADELIAAAQSAGDDEQGARRIVTRAFADRDAESLKRLALSVIARPGRNIALLGSRDTDGRAARLVFARSPEAQGDMNALMREACALLEGRGGGRPDLAQGGGTNVEQLDAALETATRRLVSTQ
ncbi:MAG TPA: DHHA1 domain-containing protein [Pyrinomonadaceae bacterium]|jgi:alanyl-tRNA synthetase|nr:DHHA1 domain-containing protein [Pyrinomonadaceae bacterium]